MEGRDTRQGIRHETNNGVSNGYVTLCFRNDTNRFINIWDGNVYYGRLSPKGWAVNPACLYINNNYFYRDWVAQTTEKDYYWNFTRYN